MSDNKRMFLEVGQRIYADWLEQRSSLRTAWARGLFTEEHAPESYLTFGTGEPAAIFVSTNPGQGYDYQLHPSVNPRSLFAGVGRYSDVAARLGRFYEAPQAAIAHAARSNIAAMKRIAAAFGRPQVTQIEMMPWHSPSLPNKQAVMARLRADEPMYAAYRATLDELLQTAPLVLSWCAGVPGRRGGAGMDMKADQIGLDLARANMLPLEARTEVSQALLWSHENGRFRGLFVTQGAASLPSAGENRAGVIKSTLLAQLAAQVRV